MNLLERLHSRFVSPRRHRSLCAQLSPLLGQGARVLDIGSGDGRLVRLLASRRPDLRLAGLDVRVRNHTFFPVSKYDGKRIPYEDAVFDAVMLIDVLHHSAEPVSLIQEAARVARQSVLIKDHLREGWIAGATLKLMDFVGNHRTEIFCSYDYWTRKQWEEVFESLGLAVGTWASDLHLYPWPAEILFGRSLHFLARLEVAENPLAFQAEHALLTARP